MFVAICAHLVQELSTYPVTKHHQTLLAWRSSTQGQTLVLCRMVPPAWAAQQASSSFGLLPSSVLFPHEMLSFTYLEMKHPQPKVSAEQLHDSMTGQQTGDLCVLPFNQSCSVPGHCQVPCHSNRLQPMKATKPWLGL